MEEIICETRQPERLNTKEYIISYNLNDISNPSITKLIIEHYSGKIIEFSLKIINQKESKLYFNIYTFKELTDIFKYDNKISNNNIYEYICNIFDNEINDNIVFDKQKKILNIKLGDKEYKLKLKEESIINENEVIKILFNELIKKKDSFDVIKMNENYNLNQMDKICVQMRKSICQIIKNNNKGIGFCVLIKYDKNNYIPVLITNNIIIDENDIKNEINETQNKKLNKNSKYYINPEFGISIIEMIEPIYNMAFLELDEKIIENILIKEEKEINNINNIYNNESIYTINYQEEINYSNGIIEYINKNNNIKHKCFSNNISLCSPILLSKNNKLIGIHTKEKNDQGILLLSPIKQFLIKYSNVFYKKEDNLINEIKIEEKNSNDEDVNNNINKNYLIIEYSISKYNTIKIFSEQFVENNRNKCKIIYENNTFDLTSNFELRKENLTIKLEENEMGIITNMSCMFHQCRSLSKVNVTNWNTKYVNNMCNLFSECKKLNTIEGISNWETDNVINMSSMFYGCSCLNPFPDISKWNTKNVKDISKMFSGCKSLPDLSKWDLSSVENMSNLFSKNSQLKFIPFISNWGNNSNNLSNVTNMSYLFSECDKLTSIPDISTWNTSNVTNMSYLFNECTQIKKISDIGNWDVSKVTNMSNLFSGCNSLISIPDISKWDMSSVTDISGLFSNCKQIKSLPDIFKWDISKVENMSDLFNECNNLTYIPSITIWNTVNIKDMSNLFKNCDKLRTIPDISNWDVSNVENMRGIFCQCKLIETLPDISKWKPFKVSNISELFCACENLKEIPDISKWFPARIENMGKIFYKCKNLKSPPDGIKNLDLSKILKEQAFEGSGITKAKIPKNFIKKSGWF